VSAVLDCNRDFRSFNYMKSNILHMFVQLKNGRKTAVELYLVDEKFAVSLYV
jgi:hypothetical protein